MSRANSGRPRITGDRNPHLTETVKKLGGTERFALGIAIPRQHRECVLRVKPDPWIPMAEEPRNPALLEHHRSSVPLAQEARKPIVHLKLGDGAIGAHMAAVVDAYRDFQRLAE